VIIVNLIGEFRALILMLC